MTYPEDLASQWVTMISQLRGAALPSTPILSYATLPIEEWRQVQFWSSLDWIGIDAWYSIGTSDNPYPCSLSHIYTRFLSLSQLLKKCKRFYLFITVQLLGGLTHLPSFLVFQLCSKNVDTLQTMLHWYSYVIV